MAFYYFLVPLAWLVWHIAFRIEVTGKENLLPGGSIVAPNHLSAIDPVFVVIVWLWRGRMRIFAKKELYEKTPLLSWFLNCMGCVAVRSGTREDLAVLDQTVEELKNGGTLLLFPEGTRSKDGEVGVIKSGAFVVADRAAVPIVPCRIIYDTPDHRAHIGCRCRVCFGPAIPAQALAMGGRDRAKLRENKQRLRQAWEQLYAEHHF